jgi:hypothetical protein
MDHYRFVRFGNWLRWITEHDLTPAQMLWCAPIYLVRKSQVRAW